jgi:hypothetical protein
MKDCQLIFHCHVAEARLARNPDEINWGFPKDLHLAEDEPRIPVSTHLDMLPNQTRLAKTEEYMPLTYYMAGRTEYGQISTAGKCLTTLQIPMHWIRMVYDRPMLSSHTAASKDEMTGIGSISPMLSDALCPSGVSVARPVPSIMPSMLFHAETKITCSTSRSSWSAMDGCFHLTRSPPAN